MVNVQMILKRGELIGTIYHDASHGSYQYFATVEGLGTKMKSPYFFDEDLAANWIEQEFDVRFKMSNVRIN